MAESLSALIAEARGLANDHPCKREHLWVSVGGRHCPYDTCLCEERAPWTRHSQAVYQCERCEVYDYGERGGPGWRDCHRADQETNTTREQGS